MDNKCIINKIDASLSGINEKLGVLCVNQTYNPNISEGETVRFDIISTETVHVTGNLTTTSGGTSTYHTETLPAGTNRFFLKNENQIVEIDNKYCIKKLTPNVNAHRYYLSINVDSLKYSQELEYINSILTGNISSLSGTDLTILYGIDSHSLFGDIAEISDLSNIEELAISNTSVSGSVESFVKGQINAGRTVPSNPLYCIGLLSQITFGGNNYGNYGDAMCLTWQSAEKIVVGKGNRVLSNCTTIYTKGYTQQEAEAEWPGKTIVRVDA